MKPEQRETHIGRIDYLIAEAGLEISERCTETDTVTKWMTVLYATRELKRALLDTPKDEQEESA